MKYPWIDEYLQNKPGVTKDLQKDWNWIRYQIGGKMFAAVCLDKDNQPYYITLKLEPSEGDFLRAQYPDIVPGYYMNKVHWNSVKPDGELPDELLKDLLDKSWQLVLHGFSRKKQLEILGETAPANTSSGTLAAGAKKKSFDYKKEYKEFYLPKTKPSIVEIPPMNYIAVRGKGDPNAENSEYKSSIGLLYAIAFTIKMSRKTGHTIEGFFDYVVPPLEGFWWQEHTKGIDYSRKDTFQFISLIRLPDFVTKDDFDWAIQTASVKKNMDFSKVEFMTYNEGLCVQCMHIGSYDSEPDTVSQMHAYMTAHGYALDITDERYHHEIYLSDARKVSPEKLKTVIRHPVKPR